MKKCCPILFLLLLTLLSAPRTAAQETAIVDEGKVNIRGRPSFIGEVVTQLDRGDKVTILERIKVDNPAPGEPSTWAKIKLPENTPVWVFAPFIKDGVVTASRLNLRAGDGENYSVLGRIDRGARVKEIRTRGQWMEIEAPDDAYAFVDASLLRRAGEPARPRSSVPRISATEQPDATTEPKPVDPITPAKAAGASVAATQTPPEEQEPASVVEQVDPPEEPEPEIQVAVAQPQTAVPDDSLPSVSAGAEATPEPAPPTDPAVEARPLPKVAEPAPTTDPAVEAQPLPKVAEPVPTEESPLPPRVVRREGIVRSTRSIQAPTWYELVHPETKRTINYLHEERLGVDLAEYKGFRVIVSGEEAIDARWPTTPILELQSIETAR